MRVEFTFCPKSPYLHTLSYPFISPPTIGVSIKPLKVTILSMLPIILIRNI